MLCFRVLKYRIVFGVTIKVDIHFYAPALKLMLKDQFSLLQILIKATILLFSYVELELRLLSVYKYSKIRYCSLIADELT